jgi:predicted KAP-like P-loop ATPase
VTEPIQIIADIPTTTPGLGFPEYVEALSDAIRGGDPPQFTIGLYGPWGSGKSSLLRGIHDRLAANHPDVVPVMFEAWRYEQSTHLVVPLLHAVTSTVSAVGPPNLTEALRKALASVVFSVNFSLMGIGFDAGKAKDAWQQDALTQLDDAFAKPFEELKKIPEALGNRRIAILIDDLDRCSPQNVVSVLEAINVVMDVPGFVFTLALDYDVLVEAVNARYPHVSGHEFVQKIIQLPFRVPPLRIDDQTFLNELIPRWSEWGSGLPDGFSRSVVDISVQALESNPRQIKRLANSFLVLERIVKLRRLDVDFEVLTALLGLQLGWPAQYQEFQDSVILGGNFMAIFDDDESTEALRQYGARFFAGSAGDTAKVRELLQLTSVVAGEEVMEATSAMSVAREAHREEFIEQLAQMGYYPSTRSERLYYNQDRPDVRFVMEKHVVRLEKKDRGKWRLWESYLLSRETHLALRAAKQPDVHFTNRT